MEKIKKQLIIKIDFIRQLELNGGYFLLDTEKNYRWKHSAACRKLEEYERMLRFSQLQKLNKPNDFIIEYLSNIISENYFRKFNNIYQLDKSLQDSFLFCKELLDMDKVVGKALNKTSSI